MRRTLTICTLTLAAAAGSMVAVLAHPSRAQVQDGGGGAAQSPSSPAEVAEKVMTCLDTGRIDDAVTLMPGLKDVPDERDAAKATLVALRDEQGLPHGHDLVAVQKFSGRMQADDVLAYFEKAPVLMRFTFYQPRAGGEWTVLALTILPAGRIGETLHDAPVDYVGQRK